jgi:hypothetical protein
VPEPTGLPIDLRRGLKQELSTRDDQQALASPAGKPVGVE